MTSTLSPHLQRKQTRLSACPEAPTARPRRERSSPAPEPLRGQEAAKTEEKVLLRRVTAAERRDWNSDETYGQGQRQWDGRVLGVHVQRHWDVDRYRDWNHDHLHSLPLPGRRSWMRAQRDGSLGHWEWKWERSKHVALFTQYIWSKNTERHRVCFCNTSVLYIIASKSVCGPEQKRDALHLGRKITFKAAFCLKFSLLFLPIYPWSTDVQMLMILSVCIYRLAWLKLKNCSKYKDLSSVFFPPHQDLLNF